MEKRIGATIAENLYEKLCEYAKENELSLSDVIRDAMAAFLEDYQEEGFDGQASH